jgi:hypothetical protein
MNKAIFLLAVILLGSKDMLFAQDVNMATENMYKMLCKKWKVDHAVVDGLTISPKPGAGFDFEFKQDNTFKMTGNGSASKGTWSYDAGKKLVRLNRDDTSNSEFSEIISLKEDEFVMITDMKGATLDDPTPLKTVFVPVN